MFFAAATPLSRPLRKLLSELGTGPSPELSCSENATTARPKALRLWVLEGN